MEPQQVAVRFEGGVLASLGRTLLYVLLALFVLPTAWGAVSLLRWWVQHMRFADDSRLEFSGRGGQIWGLFAAMVVLAVLPQLANRTVSEHKALAVSLLLTLVLLPLVALVKLHIYRWVVGNLVLTPGGRPVLTASYWGYLGWLVILTASILTVVGWAWVFVALARWFCGHVQGDGYTADFTGSGWGLLWHSVLWILGSLVIFPIPWVMRSVYAWFSEHLVLVREPVMPAL